MEDGKELPTLISVQEMIVPLDGVKTHTLMLVSVVWSVTLIMAALLPTSPLMEQVTRGCVVEQEDIRKEKQMAFMRITMKVRQLMTTTPMAYQSLMVILVSTSGLMLLVCGMIVYILMLIVHVQLVEDHPLLPLWVLTITVNQEVSTLLVVHSITSMTHCGMDLIATVVLTVAPTLLNHGSTES